MLIGELKRLIVDLPDDAPVIVCDSEDGCNRARGSIEWFGFSDWNGVGEEGWWKEVEAAREGSVRGLLIR